MSDTDLSLYEQMTQALDNIRRQVELLNAPSSIGGGSDDRSVIADLETEYQALRKARAELGPEDR